MGVPAGSVIVMRAPGSPRPVTCAPSAETVAVGAAGSVVSGAVSVIRGETLPAASTCVTASVWPSTCAAESVAA